MEIKYPDLAFWNRRKVLITGHTGFKGSWLSLLLTRLGSNIFGYSLDPPTKPNLFELSKIDKLVNSHIADIRDYETLQKVLRKVKPEIVIHMAAQPLVRESYRVPRETYEINVMGTINLLDAVRKTDGIRVVLNITSDKCYENREWLWGYRENEQIGGYDPYSNSKGCCELVTSCFRNSYFNPQNYKQHGVALASARAGNVIGGGDWAEDRLIPDFIRSLCKREKIIIRNPFAVRPWQHVLDPLTGYLLLCEKLYEKGDIYSEAWNFGPEEKDAKNVAWLINFLCKKWGDGASWEIDSHPNVHESNYLRLDCSKAKSLLDWNSLWNIETTLNSIVEWTNSYFSGKDIRDECFSQMEKYYSTQDENITYDQQ